MNNSYSEFFVDVNDLMLGKKHVHEILNASQAFDRAQYSFWRAYLQNIALAGFTWEGLPAGIDSRAVEYILLHFGIGAMFTDEGGVLFAQAAPADNINMFYNPNKINLFSPAGQNWQRHCNFWVDEFREVHQRDAVCLFDNMARKPLMLFIDNYARRLATIDRVIDVNIGAQKTPWIITGAEEAKGTKKDLINKLKHNDQYISVNSAMADTVQFEVLQTEAPFVADKLLDTKKRILDEAVTFLGADNANTDKRERVNTQEVLSNNEQVMLMRNSRLKCRKEFCELANVVFSEFLNEEINVKWSVPHLRESETLDNIAAGGDGEEGEEMENADQ